MMSEAPTLLANLRALRPDPRHCTRVRARCRQHFERRDRRAKRWRALVRVTRQSAPLVAAGLSVFYAVALVHTAARLFTT